MVANIAETLDNHALFGQAGRQACRGDILGMTEELLHGILHAAPGGFSPAIYPAHLRGFSGNARRGIDILGMQRPVDIGHKSHFSLPGPHVRGWHIQSRAQVAFFL